MAKIKTGTKPYQTTEKINDHIQHIGYNPKKGRKSFATFQEAKKYAFGLKKIEPIKEPIIKTF